MRGIWKRFAYYLVGFILGSILVSIIFKDRGCSWTPTNRVKTAIKDKIIVFPEDQIEKLQSMGLDANNIFKFLVEGKVDFNGSIKENMVYPKAYIIEGRDSIYQRVQFSLYEDSYITIVHALEEEEEPTRYEHLEGWGVMALLPKDSALVFVDQSNYTQCKARGLNSKEPKDLIAGMKSSGKVNFSKSDLMLQKAQQYISFMQDDTLKVEAQTIWFESRITFKDFIWEEKLDCE